MKIKLYMKSGNTLIIKRVKKYEYEYDGDDIVSLSILHYRHFRNMCGSTKRPNGVMMQSITLSQIEAIEQL